MKKWLTLVLCIALPVAVGGIAGYITRNNIQSWYRGLEKPAFNPPDAVFGPVWTILFILMGISFYLVVRQPASAKRTQAIVLFFMQLFFNFWWSILFFGFHRIGIAFIDLVLLWLLIILMIRQFYRVSAVAANLQWPYLAWVSFAGVLNAVIWYINR